jgi:hypothetical protein
MSIPSMDLGALTLKCDSSESGPCFRVNSSCFVAVPGVDSWVPLNQIVLLLRKTDRPIKKDRKTSDGANADATLLQFRFESFPLSSFPFSFP